MFGFSWEKLFQLSALVLSVVNGLILVRVHLRDRARIAVKAIHPESYQWYFRAPAGQGPGGPTRRFGFIAYVDVSNKGYRPVTLDSWHLHVRARNGKKAALPAINMPEATAQIGELVKQFPVLGQRGLDSASGNLRVESGDSICGMALYVYECFGPDVWDPVGKGNDISGRMEVRDAFGGRARCEIRFREQTMTEMEAMVPGLGQFITTIGLEKKGSSVVSNATV